MTFAALASTARLTATRCPKLTATSPIKRTTILATTRTIWQSSRQERTSPNSVHWTRLETRCFRRRFPKSEQNPQPQQQEDPFWNPTSNNWGWASRWGNDEWSAFDKRTNDIFEAQRTRMQRSMERMERVRRQIEADPHAALFGRRLMGGDGIKGLGLGLWDRERSLGDIWRRLFGVDDKGSSRAGTGTAAGAKSADGVNADAADTTARVRSVKNTSDPESATRTKASTQDSVSAGAWTPADNKLDGLEYDPISGRMVPKAPEGTDASGGALGKPNNISIEKSNGYLSPIGRPADVQVDGSVVSDDAHAHGITKPGEEASDIANKPPSSISKDTFVDVSSSGSQSAVSTETGQGASLQKQTDENAPIESPSNIPGGIRHDAIKPDIYGTQATQNLQENEPSKLKIQDSVEQSEPILVKENEELDLHRASDIRASYPEKELTRRVDEGSVKALEDQITSIQHSVNDITAQITEAKVQAVLEKPHNAKFLEHSLGNKNTLSTDSLRGSIANLRQPDEPADLLVRAYNPETDQSTWTQLSSSDDFVLPSEVTPHVNNPDALFMDMQTMHRQNYGIVAAAGDTIVFRKYTGDEKRRADEMYKQLEDSVSGQDTAKEGSAFGIGKAIRRMLFAGSATAGTCYAIGVVVEYFRTGGVDGRGIDGFTLFESERRQWEREV